MTDGPQPWSPATVRWAKRLRTWWPAAAIAVAFAVGWFAAGMWASGFGTATFRIGEQFGGTITQVSADGAAFCLRQDEGGHQRCSVAFQLVGSPHLRVDQHVEVVAGTIWPKGSAAGTEVYVITVPAPEVN